VVLLGGSGSSIIEAHQTLVDLGDADSASVGQRPNAGNNLVRMVAAARDEIGDTSTSQLSERRPGGKAPGTARVVWGPIELVSHICRVDEVARMMLHRRAMVLRTRHEGITAVVGDVEPLVPVGGPRIRRLGSSEQVPQLWHRVAPESHRTVHVHPRVSFVSQADELGEGIEDAAVDVAGLEHHDRRTVGLTCQCRMEVAGRELPDRVARQHRYVRGADAEELGRPRCSPMHLARGEDPNARSTGQAIAVDVPPRPAENRVPSRCQAGDVGHLTAGHQCEGGGRRQAEDVLQPSSTDFLDHGGCGTAGIETGVLVPRRRQPIRGQR
jgi:hypothetical protein